MDDTNRSLEEYNQNKNFISSKHNGNSFTLNDSTTPTLRRAVSIRTFPGRVNSSHTTDLFSCSSGSNLSGLSCSSDEIYRTKTKKYQTENNSKENFKQIDVTSFRRSLRLMGLQPEDFGLEKREEKGNERQSRQRTRVQPTFSTRLTKRSISLDAVRDVLKVNKPLGEHYHQTLAKAAYESWYFEKLQQARQKKKEKEEEEKLEAERKEKEISERKMKIQEKYEEWKRLKTKASKEKENANIKPLRNSQCLFALEDKDTRKDKAEKEYQTWKKKKNLMLAKKLEKENINKQENEEKKNLDQKKESEKEFAIWKQRVDAMIKEEVEKRKEKKAKEEEEKLKQKREKKEMSEKCFEAWKKRKEEEFKNKKRKERAAEEESKRKANESLTERQYEAEQAFETWIEELEEKEDRGKMEIRKEVLKKRPWLPGGIAAV